MYKFNRENFFPKKNKLDVSSLLVLYSDYILNKKIKSNFILNDVSSYDLQLDNSFFFYRRWIF